MNPSGRSMRLLSYNVKSGLQHADGLEAIERVLRVVDADVVALQEVDDRTQRSGAIDQTAWLRERLGFVAGVFGDATPWPGGGRYGVAILSRWPIVEHAVERLWVPAPGAAPESETEPRVALATRIAVGDATVCAVTLHLGLSATQRRRQTVQVVDFVTSFRRGAPVLVAGDFNADPDAVEMDVVHEAWRDAMVGRPYAERVSFPSRCLRSDGSRDGGGHGIACDYVFASDGVQATAVVAHDDSCASDHDPIVATCVVGTSAG